MDQHNGTPSQPPKTTYPPNLEFTLNTTFQELISRHPALTIDQVFYLEASQLYLQFLHKKEEVQRAQQEIQELREKLGMDAGQRKRVSANQGSQSGNQNGSDKKKRSRRTAVEIARHYICTIDKCNKSYGSEGSLNQHIKIKHPNEYSQHMLMMDLSRPNSQ